MGKNNLEFDSEWILPTVELIKCLRETEKSTMNEDLGSIDYIVNDEKGKTLIRALVDENKRPAPAYVETINYTIKEIEDSEYDEAVLLGKRITNSAHDLVTQHSEIAIITPNTKNSFSIGELVKAIQTKTRALCKHKCDKTPKEKLDCKGKKGRSNNCDIRRVSDDAKFHLKMKWESVLLKDFYKLCELERTISEVN